MIKKNKGITLISLVITIIILIILAGIAIATLTGKNGLFSRAKQAKQKSEEEQTKENATITDYESKVSEYVDESNSNNIVNYDKNVYDCWNTWIYLAGENPNLYKSSEILNNEALMQKVMNNKNAMNYLLNSQTFIMPAVMQSKIANTTMKDNLVFIPNMTSNTEPSGEAKASNSSENLPYGAFSGFWNDENIEKYGKWGCIHKIKIQGSNNEIEWNDLTEEIECKPFTKYNLYPTKNIDEYQYYRLNVLSRTETWGSRTDVLIFQVYGYEK